MPNEFFSNTRNSAIVVTNVLGMGSLMGNLMVFSEYWYEPSWFCIFATTEGVGCKLMWFVAAA